VTSPPPLPVVGPPSGHVSDALVEPLRRVLRWLVSHVDDEGRLICPDHEVEHTGKNAYVIVLAAELARRDPHADRDALRALAVTQGRRLVANLQREGDSTCFTFRPGRHDPFNCSNNVIDGGACSDALAELVQLFGPELSAEDREAFTRASVLHAQTYLRYAVLDKGIPAQSAWALTGVANAWRISQHAVLELTVSEGAGRLAGIQHRDGSYPYHPLDQGASHVGSGDVSAFYQSRVTGFLLYALERLGRNAARPPFRVQIAAGLEFLRALVGPDGVKVGGLEAKPWYWGAEYEVASNPFDVYTLAVGGRVLGDKSLIALARRSFDAWARHLGPDGAPRDHLPGQGRRRSYQCAVFWAAHAAWAARALGELEGVSATGADGPGGLVIDVRHFANASLVRLEDSAVIAWVRGARPAGNVHHGAPRGAGLLRVVSKATHEDLFVAWPRAAAPFSGEWSAQVGRWSRARARAAVAGEVRFAGWLARAYARRGERLRALGTPLEVLRRGALEFGGARVSSAYVLDPTLDVHADGVTLHSGLAWRDGARVPGVEIVRTYRVEGDGLAVEEALTGPTLPGLRHCGPRGERTALGDRVGSPGTASATPRLTWRVRP
jgi:hypothetical protein